LAAYLELIFHSSMAETARSFIRVLLVEDEPKLRFSLAEGLSFEECQVISAACGREAFLYLETKAFDVIVLDWMLPDYDGVEIVRQLRARGNQTPVLVISARGGAAAEDVARQAGANGYLAKPFSFDDLLERTRALVKTAA